MAASIAGKPLRIWWSVSDAVVLPSPCVLNLVSSNITRHAYRRLSHIFSFLHLAEREIVECFQEIRFVLSPAMARYLLNERAPKQLSAIYVISFIGTTSMHYILEDMQSGTISRRLSFFSVKALKLKK